MVHFRLPSTVHGRDCCRLLVGGAVALQLTYTAYGSYLPRLPNLAARLAAASRARALRLRLSRAAELALFRLSCIAGVYKGMAVQDMASKAVFGSSASKGISLIHCLGTRRISGGLSLRGSERTFAGSPGAPPPRWWCAINGRLPRTGTAPRSVMFCTVPAIPPQWGGGLKPQ